MKAAFKKGREIALRDIEERAIGPHEVRLAVEACGICGSDLHLHPDSAVKEIPFGHEVAGRVLELGAAVRGLEAGQTVVLDSSTPCGICTNCRNMRQDLCTDRFSPWNTWSFGMAETMIAPGACAFPYSGLAPEVACLQEPLGVAIDIVRVADITPDSNVLLMGPGPIGLMALQLARHAGARRLFVSGFKSQSRRMELALQFGADAFIDPSETPLETYDFDCDIDRILVTSPPRTLSTAFRVAARGGILSFIGIEYGEGASCTFDANEFHFKKLQLRSSFASPALFGPRAVRYLSEGVVDGAAMVSHRYPLAQIGQAMETARTDPAAVKVVVMPGG